MMQNNQASITVSVIIPTMCLSSRSELLKRTIKSITNQSDVHTEILVVLNGLQYDTETVKELEANPLINLIRLETANVSTARYIGVCQSQGDFFCFIDDDDEFLENAFQIRLNTFLEHDVDFIISNGLLNKDGVDKIVVEYDSVTELRLNPAANLLKKNWFASSAGFYKAKSFNPELFNFSYKYFEMTYLFFLLISNGKTFYFNELLTYRVYQDQPLSVSKSNEYMLAHAVFLRNLMKFDLESSIKKFISKKYIAALNMQSNIEIQQGLKFKAWLSHLKCLLNGGWEYIPYTRHLIRLFL